MEDLSAITDRLKLLSDPTRLRVLHLLQREELTVGELAAALGQGQSTISTHLARLREAGLVRDRRNGTRSFYRLEIHTLADAGRPLWELLERRLGDDPVLGADLERMERIVLARLEGTWVDRAAGSLDRRYVPGRSFETLAVGLASLMRLGDCADMGSGDGALLDLVAPACRTLVCIDDHRGMVEAGAKRVAASDYSHVRFIQGDMHEPPLADASIDTVLFLQSLQYAADPPRALRAAGRITRGGGRCLVLTLGTHGDRRIQQDYGHRYAGFAAATLAAWLEDAGFAVTRCERTGHDPRSPQLPILVGAGRKPDGDGP